MNRHEFLQTIAGAAITAASTHAQRPPIGIPETVVYKVVQGCEIKLDI